MLADWATEGWFLRGFVAASTVRPSVERNRGGVANSLL
jgi:hypothetical protein